MNRINWTNLRNNIPTRLKVATKRFFEILWSEDMKDTTGTMLHGKTEFDPDRIIINVNQSNKDAVLTLWHEHVHALDHTHDIKLTEGQVIKLEKCYPYVREFVLTVEGIKK